MASFRVLFFIFSALLWGQACSAPAPAPAHTPVPGEIVRIKPSHTTGPQFGDGANHPHYYIALGPHPNIPDHHMAAGVTHGGRNGNLGPVEPLPTSGPGKAHGLTGDVLLKESHAHVQNIKAPIHGQHQGVVSKQWIKGYRQHQDRSKQVHQERANARTANDRAAKAHSDAHDVHIKAAAHVEAGDHRKEHDAQAKHHYSEAQRHTTLANEHRKSVIRPLWQHHENAKQSSISAASSEIDATHSRNHAEAALSHMHAVGVHRSAQKAHESAAVNNRNLSKTRDHRQKAQGHMDRVMQHRQSAADHSPSRHKGDPILSRHEAEKSHQRGAVSLRLAQNAHPGPAQKGSSSSHRH